MRRWAAHVDADVLEAHVATLGFEALGSGREGAHCAGAHADVDVDSSLPQQLKAAAADALVGIG